jgi:proteasome alpha subunit
MIEEPYRWIEAIQNRREYIEHQLATGSPIVALAYDDGILFVTLSRERQKVFEIYDRIAMGAIGHPGDIERLRMAAIEVSSTEGFTRSSQDVSLRRLANYSLSPALKAAFEQVYGAPYLARMLFAELGRGHDQNLFMRIDYDGTIHSNGGTLVRSFENFGVISGTQQSAAAMEAFLQKKDTAASSLANVLDVALDAWSAGHLAMIDDSGSEPPAAEKVASHRAEQLGKLSIEAAVLERSGHSSITYRALGQDDLKSLLNK